MALEIYFKAFDYRKVSVLTLNVVNLLAYIKKITNIKILL